MRNLLKPQPTPPRIVTDPGERNAVAAQVRATVLATMPGTSPFAPQPSYHERALHGELMCLHQLQDATLAVAEHPGPIASIETTTNCVVLITCPGAVIPGKTRNRYAGLRVANWPNLWQPSPVWRAPDIATADIVIPSTLEELHEQFVANIVVLDEKNMLATGDVVVPPLYGARAHIVHIPPGVKVRALALSAGHNKFVPATQAVLNHPRRLALA